VTGAHHLEISLFLEQAAAPRARVVWNPQHELGQFSSLRAGLAASVAPEHPTVVLPVDVPPLTGLDLEALVEACRLPGVLAAVPEHAGRPGHPVVLAPAAVEAIAALPDDATLRDWLAGHEEAVAFVPSPDAAVLEDIDTREDLLHVRRRFE
jgi:CTP:molybdopterin cytidylyltransferase MocA